nr:putative serine/threonine/dual specificity protein kinase, catalytic domain-containing protein [Tanacetum cinerariifolium]
MLVVYEYISGGDFEKRLHKVDGKSIGTPLSLVERLKICIEAARALDYLHTGTGVKNRIIHRDVKSLNILLDGNMTAKVSDLGLLKIGPVNESCTHESTDVKGSLGYLDLNYFMTHRITRKSNVYSFGVVLLEILCGRTAVDPSLGDDEGLVG